MSLRMPSLRRWIRSVGTKQGVAPSKVLLPHPQDMVEYARLSVSGGDKHVEALNTVETTEEQEQVITDLREIDVSKLPSPVLARLIEEVRNEETSTPNAYSRFHNRHNRSR